MLTAFIRPFLAKRLIIKTKNAIATLQNANSYNDVKDMDVPSILELSRKAGSHATQ